MTSVQTASAARFPMRFLTIAVILTGVVLVWLGWGAYKSYREIRTIKERDFRIEQLRGTIMLWDEVLTMSARMAAVTGEKGLEAGATGRGDDWERRYKDHEKQLEEAIQEVIELAPQASAMAQQTDQANRALV